MRRQLLLGLLLLLDGCQLFSGRPSFDDAYSRARAQPLDSTHAYDIAWTTFNNANHLDEKDGCYDKAPDAIRQVLVIDEKGVIADVIADADNAKSQCFRRSYLHVQFPAPPFAPYYQYMYMCAAPPA